MNRAPLPWSAPRGASSPTSLVLRAPPTSRHPSRLASFPSVSGTSLLTVFRVPSGSRARGVRRARASGLGCGLPDDPHQDEEMTRPPRFLGRLRARAVLYDPGGASAPMILGRSGAAFR